MSKEIVHILRGGSDETWCGKRSAWNFFGLDHAAAMGLPNEAFVPPGTFKACPDCLHAALKQIGYQIVLRRID